MWPAMRTSIFPSLSLCVWQFFLYTWSLFTRASFAGLALTSCLLGLSGCSARVPPSPEEVDASMATLNWLNQEFGLAENADLNHLLSGVTKRLADGIYGFALEREIGQARAKDFRSYPWQVFVIRNPSPNAFSLGAGAIVLTTGLLAEIHSEAELASIISHEMSHHILGHTTQAISRMRLSTAQAPEFTFSLNDEVDADTLGLKLLFVARYDPRHATQALTIPYRPLRENVSHERGVYSRAGYNSVSYYGASVPPDWLRERMANIQHCLEEYPVYVPATQNSRDFYRAWQHLPS